MKLCVNPASRGDKIPKRRVAADFTKWIDAMKIRIRTSSSGFPNLGAIAWIVCVVVLSISGSAWSQDVPKLDGATSIEEANPDSTLSLERAFKERKSIERVPLSADLYISVFHLRASLQNFLSSHLVKEIMHSQAWQKSQVAFLKEWKDRKSDIGRYRTLWENQSVKELLRFLEDVASEDLFLYADGSLSKTLLQVTTILKKLHVLTSGEIRAEVKADLVAQWIDQVLPSFQFPTLMVGGRFSDQDLALAKVDEIEGLVRFGIGAIPDAAPLLKPLKRIEDVRGSRLQWQVFGKSLPWDSIPEGDILDRESLQDLRNAVAEKSLTLTFGMIDGYFVASISGDPEGVDRFGSGEDLLKHPQVTPVRELRSQEGVPQSSYGLPASVTNVTWISDELANAAFEFGLHGFFERVTRATVHNILPNIAKDSDLREFLTQLVDEGARVDALIEPHVPKLQGYLGWSSNSDAGWESFGMSRTEGSLFDGDAPLDCVVLTEEKPLLLLDVRLANHPEYFQAAREVVKRLRVLGLAALEVDDDEIGNASIKPWIRSVVNAWPSLERWADNWQQKIMSNFAGEHAFIITSNGPAARQWHPALPPSDEPLVFPAFRLIHLLKDEQIWWEGILANGKIMLDFAGAGSNETLLQGLNRSLSRFPASGFDNPDHFAPRVDIRAPGPNGPALAVWTHTPNKLANREWTLSSDTSLLSKQLGIIDPSAKQSVVAFIDLGGIIKHWRPWLRYGLLLVADNEGQRLPIPKTSRGTELEINVDDVLALVDILGSIGTLSSSRETRHFKGDGMRKDSFGSNAEPLEWINRWRAVYQAPSTN